MGTGLAKRWCFRERRNTSSNCPGGVGRLARVQCGKSRTAARCPAGERPQTRARDDGGNLFTAYLTQTLSKFYMCKGGTMRLSRSLSIAISLVFVGFIILFSGTQASATYAGRNGRIAFVSDVSGTFQLYTINPDGSDMVQITNLPPTVNSLWFPDYSPDGRKILFSHDMTGPLELYAINVDGSGLAQLT